LTAIASSLVLLSGSIDAVADPFAWIIAVPDGTVETGSGDSFDFRPLVPGTYTIMLTVQYAHEDPSCPGSAYVATATEYLEVTGPDLRRIFADDFETGTTTNWTRTVP